MPEYNIQSMPPQISAEILSKLSRVETATIGHSRHWGFLHPDIQALLPGKRLVGTAVTLALPAQDSTLLHHALSLVRPGDVMVIDRLGDNRHACWGGGVTIAARAAGLAGAIVDGPATDITEIRDSDFPIWARGLSPITTRRYNLGGSLNLPVSCGGVSVQPGDAVLADESGVLILPKNEVEAIANEAIVRQAYIEEIQQRVKSGEKLGDLLGASKMIADAIKKNTD